MALIIEWCPPIQYQKGTTSPGMITSSPSSRLTAPSARRGCGRSCQAPPRKGPPCALLRVPSPPSTIPYSILEPFPYLRPAPLKRPTLLLVAFRIRTNSASLLFLTDPLPPLPSSGPLFSSWTKTMHVPVARPMLPCKRVQGCLPRIRAIPSGAAFPL